MFIQDLTCWLKFKDLLCSDNIAILKKTFGLCPNDYEQVCIMAAMQVVLVNIFVYFSLLHVYLFVCWYCVLLRHLRLA